MPPVDPSQELVQALAVLAVEDVLALCYRFRTNSQRLHLYLDVLRRRGGHKAALAASLICFDLANQGRITAQREFPALAETLRDFENTEQDAQDLVAGSDYLEDLWPRCRKALQSMDLRVNATEVLEEDVEVVEIHLLDDDDLDDFDDLLVESLDVSELVRQLKQLLAVFFDYEADRPAPSGSRGFFAVTRQDLERVEAFIRELDSLREFVPQARSMLAMAQLFLAAHLRSRNFWGRPNLRKVELVRNGLQHFITADQSVFAAAAHFVGRDADANGWSKVAQVLLDFLAWTMRHWKGPLLDAAAAYAEQARELPRLDSDERRATSRSSFD